MPRLTRNKTSDAVVDHVIERLFAGELTSGDRIDLDAIAEELGISRSPVREAMVLLERDGLVEMPYHRGAFVAEVNAATVLEAFSLYGMLNGRTSAIVAARGDAATLRRLEDDYELAAAAVSPSDFELRARAFRRTINRAAAGPHLKALLRTFGGLVPAASRLGMSEGMEEERVLLHRELEAHRGRDAVAAAGAAIAHIDHVGRRAVDVLVRRGVLARVEPDDFPLPTTWLSLATLETP